MLTLSRGPLDENEKAALKKLSSEVVDFAKELDFWRASLERLAKRWKAGEDLTQPQHKRANEITILPRPNRVIEEDVRSFRSVDSFDSE